MKNNDNNQGVTETPSYIIVTVDTDSKLIMTYIEGMEFLRIWSTATEMYQRYSHDTAKIRAVNKQFEIKFISEEQYKEIKMAGVIGASPEDD
jgi:hypothetical protein